MEFLRVRVVSTRITWFYGPNAALMGGRRGTRTSRLLVIDFVGAIRGVFRYVS